LHVYEIEILLMMYSGPVQNMQSILSNKSEKLWISFAFIVGMYHDTQSSECQMSNYLEVQEVQKVKAQLWEEAQIAAAFAEAGG
jgi:hypothetical protein